MKKIIILLVTIIFLSGCGNNWEKKIQLSTLKLEDSNIVGKMKNTTNNAYNVKIIFNLLSGTLEEEKTCEKIIKPNETLDFECYISDIDDSYIFNVKNVELNLIEIPELTENPSEEAVKYYFQNIYDNHKMNFKFLDVALNSSNSQIFNMIEFENDGLRVYDSFEIDGINFFLSPVYNTNTEKIDYLLGQVNSIDNLSLISEVMKDISILIAVNNEKYVPFASKIEKALLNPNLEDDKCWMISDLCIAAIKSEEDNTYTFAIEFDR